MNCEFLPWESELFGKQAGRLVSVEDGDEISACSYDFVYARVLAGEEEQVSRLVRRGFELVETALVLTRRDGRLATPREAPEVREATDAEVEEAAAIAHDAFHHSRFHRDPRIPDAVARRSRQSWVHNARHQGRGTVLVALADETVAGFLVHREAEGSSVLDLIGVRETHQRRGIGTALVAGYLASSHAASFRVTTQASNLESLELYRATGYRYHDLHYSLHWHRPGS